MYEWYVYCKEKLCVMLAHIPATKLVILELAHLIDGGYLRKVFGSYGQSMAL